MDETCVVNWNIKNVSYWEDRLRLTVDSELLPPRFPQILLYGIHGYLVIRLPTVSEDPEIELSGDLCFMLPDGSPIGEKKTFTQRRTDLQGTVTHQVLLGPQSKEVLSQLEEFPEDRLTIVLRLRSKERKVHQLHTELKVAKESLNVSLSQLEEGKPFEHECAMEPKTVLTVSAGPDPDSKIEFALRFKYNSLPYKVHAHWSFVAGNGSVIRSEQKVHARLENHGKETLTLFDSLTRGDVKTEGISAVVLHLDMAPSKEGQLICSHYVTSTTNNEVAIRPLKTPEASGIVLNEHFKSLYFDKDFTDFKIHCDSVTFPVHRNILAVRSPVFKTMLSRGMKEAVSGEVDIVDLDARTVSRFLAFLYTGKVNGLQSDSALELYYAADKYRVPSLKRVCRDFLCDNTSASNVDDILLLGKTHQDSELVTQARKFLSLRKK